MKQKKNKNISRGAGIFYVVMSILFLIMLGRFLYIQVTGKVNGEEVAAHANTPYNTTLSLVAERGTILDRYGNVLARDTAAYTVVAIVDEEYKDSNGEAAYVDDPEAVAEVLAPIINMTEEDIYSLLTNVSSTTKQVELGPGGRGISIKKKNQIAELNLKGITFLKDTKRYYPNGDFASYVIGYTKVADESDEVESDTVGAMGIESQYDALLQETNGYVKYERDTNGNRLAFGDREIVDAEDGATVELTIDYTIQSFLEEAMDSMVSEYSPEKAIAIVMNPKTGEVLALSNYPSFDPNKKNITNYLNDAISYTYEPGSTMKIFTLAAAIEEGVWNSDETFQSGSYKVGGNTIRDHNKVGWGEITYLEGIQRSSNVAMANIVDKKLGTETFYEYLKKFGFMNKTGIDLPQETKGTIVYNYKIEQLTTAFGQGSTVTAMQQIAAATAIANGGNVMKPYVVKSVTDSTGEVIKENSPAVSSTPISKSTAKEVREILETVVTSAKGTGNAYKINGYNVAGKTGTAQIPNSDGTGYLSGEGQYVYSFLGMAPANDPELIMYVAVQQPELDDMESGSEPVSSVFTSVMKSSLQYLNVEQTKKNSSSTNKTESEYSITIPDVIDKNVENAKTKLEKLGVDAVVVGEGTVVKEQLPAADSTVLSGEKVILKTTGKAKMVSIKNWSLRDVRKLALLYDLELLVEGTGYVTAQSIKENAELKTGDTLSIKLSNTKIEN